MLDNLARSSVIMTHYYVSDPLDSDAIRIASQKDIQQSGYAIQLRITAEDPSNNFAPDYGKVTAFRAGEGFGIRLDSGNGFDGAVISPHYDSLLIKVIGWSLDFDQAAKKALRSIREFRIRGVQVNPLTVKRTPADPVPHARMAAFRKAVAPLLARIDAPRPLLAWN